MRIDPQGLPLPDLPRPQTFAAVFLEFVTGRVNRRMRTIERKHTLMRDAVSDLRRFLDELEHYMQSVGQAAMRDCKRLEAELAEVRFELKEVQKTAAGALAAQYRASDPDKTPEYLGETFIRGPV